MAQKLQTELSLIEWCDRQAAEGKKLSIGWDGGGDSGWCWFEIDDEQVPDNKENEYIRGLLNSMYNQLDYGSWAGEFQATGYADYDSEQKAFVGVDNYSEDQTECYSCEIQIRIPKKLWFDVMEIQIQDEDVSVDSAFSIRNGFLTEEHNTFLEEFNKQFESQVQEVITRFCNDSETGEYRSVWQNWQLTRNEFSEEGDDLVYTIEDINIGTYNEEEKEIFLELEHLNTDEYDG